MRAVALGIALAWGLLGIAGIAFSVMEIARLPSADLGDAIRVSILLVVLIGGASGAWAAVRERWPAIRDWPVPLTNIRLGWACLVLCSLFGFAIIAAATIEAWRQPVPGPFQLAASCAVSMAMMLGAYTYYRRFEIERILLRFIAAITIMACVALLLFARTLLDATMQGGAIALLALGIATLWLSRGPKLATPA